VYIYIFFNLIKYLEMVINSHRLPSTHLKKKKKEREEKKERKKSGLCLINKLFNKSVLT
jgi:hypothetical protein